MNGVCASARFQAELLDAERLHPCSRRASSLPYFSLSWVLTLLAHDLSSIELTSRIYDFLLAHNPVMVAYLCAAVSAVGLSKASTFLDCVVPCHSPCRRFAVQIVIAKKEDLEALDPDIANDPATLHTVLSKLPDFTTEFQPVWQEKRGRSSSPSPRSMPSSPKLGASRPPSRTHSRASSMASSAAFGAFSLFGDPDADVPSMHMQQSGSLNHQRTGRSDSRTRHRPKAILLETVFSSALQLYEQYPIDHPEVQANTIFGHNSVVYTWARPDLTAEDAERIIREGSDVVIPEPPAEGTGDDADKGFDDEKHEIIRRRKQQSGRLQIRFYLASLLALKKGPTIFALVGLAGVLIAIYARDAAHPNTSVLGVSVHNWVRSSWLMRWCFGKI